MCDRLGLYEYNRVMCLDSYEAIKTIPDKSVDLIVTDPPYQIDSTTGGKRNELGKSITSMNEELENGVLTKGVEIEILEEMYRVMKKPNIYIWCNHKQIPQYLDFFVKEKGCSFDILIWNKTNATPLFNNKYLTDKEYCLYFRKGGYCNPKDYESAKTVWNQPINIDDKNKYFHPTIKPYRFIRTIIENSSKKADLVADFFMGSGTVGEACRDLERDFIGSEIEQKWCDIANDRVNGINAHGQTSIFTFTDY